MIQFVTRSKKNPKTANVAYYAQMGPTNAMTFDDVAEEIEKMCTVTDADIKAVLMGLETSVISALKRGQTVRLGSLGSFRPTLSSTSAETAEKVTASNIKRVRCRFTPGSKLANALQLSNLEFQAYKLSTDAA